MFAKKNDISDLNLFLALSSHSLDIKGSFLGTEIKINNLLVNVISTTEPYSVCQGSEEKSLVSTNYSLFFVILFRCL